jgi:phosphatidylglycerophosphatase C
MSRTVAAFDVDGTLTTHDCVVPFLRRVAGWRPLVATVARRPVLAASVALGRGDRDRLKELAVGAAVRGRPYAELEALAEPFADHVHRERMRTDTVARLHWHRAQGHDVVLVSASLGVYLRPLAERLGVEHVIGTEVVVGPDGRCTGDLEGGNCRGPEKARRLARWLDGSAAHVVAYGDSAGDRELLAAADVGVWVKGRVIAAVPGPESTAA